MGKKNKKNPIPEKKLEALFENQEQKDAHDKKILKVLNNKSSNDKKAKIELMGKDENAETLYAQIGRRTLRYIFDKLIDYQNSHSEEYLNLIMESDLTAIDVPGVRAFMDLYTAEPDSVFLTGDEVEDLLEMICRFEYNDISKDEDENYLFEDSSIGNEIRDLLNIQHGITKLVGHATEIGIKVNSMIMEKL